MKFRLAQNTKLEILKYILSMLMVMLIGTCIILSQGNSPTEAFQALITGSVGSVSAIGTTIRWATPSIITGIAAVIAFKSGIWNVGIEGQMYFGAFLAAIIGASVAVPKIIHIPLCLAAAGIGGMLFAFIPAILKLTLNVNELICTLMLNYAASLFTEYLTFKYMGFDASELADAIATPDMLPTARLGTIIPKTSASTAIFIALGIAILVYLLYKYTVKGYELKMVGENLRFSKYGGINYKRTFILIFLLSGFIAGVCGGTEMTGSFGKFRPAFATNLGWDGVMIASIAKNNPIAVIFISIFWGMLKSGSFHMERVTNTNRLVRFYPGATGLKTGSTDSALYCLSATAERDGMELIAVVMKAPSSAHRFDDAKALLDYGFSAWSLVSVYPDSPLAPIPVLLGTVDQIQPQLARDCRLLVRKGQEGAVTTRLTLAQDLEAPVEPGQTVGELEVSVDGQVRDTVPILAAQGAGRLTVPRIFTRLLRQLLMAG